MLVCACMHACVEWSHMLLLKLEYSFESVNLSVIKPPNISGSHKRDVRFLFMKQSSDKQSKRYGLPTVSVTQAPPGLCRYPQLPFSSTRLPPFLLHSNPTREWKSRGKRNQDVAYNRSRPTGHSLITNHILLQGRLGRSRQGWRGPDNSRLPPKGSVSGIPSIGFLLLFLSGHLTIEGWTQGLWLLWLENDTKREEKVKWKIDLTKT